MYNRFVKWLNTVEGKGQSKYNAWIKINNKWVWVEKGSKIRWGTEVSRDTRPD